MIYNDSGKETAWFYKIKHNIDWFYIQMTHYFFSFTNLDFVLKYFFFRLRVKFYYKSV